MDSNIRQTSTLPQGIHKLNAIAAIEGYGMVQKLISNFKSAQNCFNKTGEALYAAYEAERLVGIGGINIDPYFNQPELGRIRHVYVHPEHRRTGIGRALITRIESGASIHFDSFQLFTSQLRAAQFYESLGYLAVTGKWKVSHIKQARYQPTESAIDQDQDHSSGR